MTETSIQSICTFVPCDIKWPDMRGFRIIVACIMVR